MLELIEQGCRVRELCHVKFRVDGLTRFKRAVVSF